MRVFFVGLRSLVYPWAEARPLKGARSRWTGITRYPETDTYHLHGPPWLAGLGLRRWYTYLVYPQHRVILILLL
jgi:hypothetical protein